MAYETRRVRIGPLVANTVLRHPAVLAKAAAAVDHLSQGRLELALGKGVEEFDHMAVGVPYWTARERAARFGEYVEIVDGLLRSAETPFTFEGRYYSTREATIAPAPVQRPRPPIGGAPSLSRLLEAAHPWETPDAFARIVTSFRDAGIFEVSVMCPPDDKLPVLKRAANVIASVRGD